MRKGGSGPGRWAARPWRARALRAAVYLGPIAASVAFVRVATRVTGTPTSSLALFLTWWFALSLVATFVVAAVYNLTRRLLPLGALLELALAFPREAPSRFRLALTTGTVEELEDRLRSAPGQSPQEAAEILLQLVAALDHHDHITRGHAERVRAYARTLGRELGLTDDGLDRLNWAALLHDIGKLRVSGKILNKPGKPNDEEWAQLRDHPLYGEELIAPIRSWLGDWADAVGFHHERWDGKGYPRGVAGEAIPLAGRIVAIADVYDVITSTRSYKVSATPAEAREELVRCAGEQFDPRLVRAFVNISLGRMRAVMGPLAWLSHAPLLARFPLTPSLGAALAGISALTATATVGLAAQHDDATAAPIRVPVARSAPAVTTATRTPVAAYANHVPVSHLTAHRKKTAHATTKARAHPPSAGTTTTAAKAKAKAKHPSAGATVTTTSQSTPTTHSTGTTPPPPTTATPTGTAPRTTTTTTGTTTTTTATTTTSTTTATTTTTITTSPPPPAPNAAPAFHVGAAQTVLEDSGAVSAGGWATAISPGAASESGQAVSFTASVSSPSLFSAAPAVAPNGTLTFTPAPNANGSAQVTVTAHDDGGTANGGSDTSGGQTFTITIVAVNDAPSFTRGGNQTVVSLLGAQTVQNWASGISAGAPDEAGQSVSFVVSVDKPNLFATQPSIAADGTLTYRPKALALGTATITVRAVDSGDTANGGANTSAPVSFTITII